MALTSEEKRHICGKHIIIVEGPSAAGKSALLQRLSGIPKVFVVSRSLEKREFGTYEAGAKSFLNDNNKMMHALLAKESVVFIDRCVASQQVYHAIRTDQKVKTYPTPDSIALLMLDELERDLAWRLDQDPRRVNLYWMFLIPTCEALRKRRETGGKEYPNRPEDEIFHYKYLSNALIMERREVLRPAYENKEDQNYIFRAFEKWLTYYPYLTFSELWRSFALSKERTKTNGKMLLDSPNQK